VEPVLQQRTATLGLRGEEWQQEQEEVPLLLEVVEQELLAAQAPPERQLAWVAEELALGGSPQLVAEQLAQLGVGQ